MEFKKAMRIWKRMCGANSECNGHCALYDCCPGGGVPLEYIECSSVNKIETILAIWAEEHPEKTIADDFYEKHPNAPGKQDKQPLPCAVHCGYIDKCPDDFSALECKKCWRRPLEEAER